MNKRRAVPDPELTEVIGGTDDGTKIPRKKFLVLAAAEWLLKEISICVLCWIKWKNVAKEEEKQ